MLGSEALPICSKTTVYATALAALLLAQLTPNETQYWRSHTRVTPENVCLLRALDLNPCDDPSPPQRKRTPASEQNWGTGHPTHYD